MLPSSQQTGMRLVTGKDLLDDLRHSCGVMAGQDLIVHASMKSIGQVEGGPRTVISALLEAIGPRGTLLMPVFSDPRPDGVFHMASTPSQTGLITEVFRTSPGVIRSRHPTHSVAAFGPRAGEFLAGHDRVAPVGPGSPFHKAALAGARLLLIGCDLRVCSLIHVAEAIVRVPYLGKTFYEGYDRDLTLVDVDGSRQVFPPRDAPGDSSRFGIVEERLRRRGQITDCRLGQARCLTFIAADALEAAIDILRENPAAFLCDNPRCPVCPQARSIPQAAL